ncbi:ABC transporter ATP-binding protein [Balneolales bacterium ANBcel1]|nr:ABC transporter ATP-binding protein [Balneolales bacterium ANBcel1]
MNTETIQASFIASLKHVTKKYTEGDKTNLVLDRLDLEIKQAELIVLLGKSGSGKSTLLNILSGIDHPDGGRVTIGGENITAMSEHERTLFRRNYIGFVFQSFNLIPTLTVMENVLLPLSLKGEESAVNTEKAMQFLEEVGLADRAVSFPDRLSGGEQQRVAIARAMIHRPLLILADEPTGNLDHRTAEHVIRLMTGLARENNQTILIATHDEDLCRLADRVLQLESGRPVFLPSPRHTVTQEE